MNILEQRRGNMQVKPPYLLSLVYEELKKKKPPQYPFSGSEINKVSSATHTDEEMLFQKQKG